MDTNVMQNANNKKKGIILYPWIVTIVGTVMMLVVILLPFATATKEHKQRLLQYPNLMYVQEVGMTCKDAVDISLVEYVRVYSVAAEQGYNEGTAVASIAIIVVYGIFALIALLLAVFKKPIGVVIFDMFAMVAFWIIRFDFEDRGVVPSSTYDCGVGSWLTYVMGVVVVAAAVWLFVEKRRIKKVKKQEML